MHIWPAPLGFHEAKKILNLWVREEYATERDYGQMAMPSGNRGRRLTCGVGIAGAEMARRGRSGGRLRRGDKAKAMLSSSSSPASQKKALVFCRYDRVTSRAILFCLGGYGSHLPHKQMSAPSCGTNLHRLVHGIGCSSLPVRVWNQDDQHSRQLGKDNRPTGSGALARRLHIWLSPSK